jgi:hypothetical protein
VDFLVRKIGLPRYQLHLLVTPCRVESVMPVHFVPRTEACSSTLLRTIYHADDEELRKKAAFAKTRYDGKPIDEDGNVL